MVGAAVGIDGIPKTMQSKILKFDCEKRENNTRPSWLSTKNHNTLIEEVMPRRDGECEETGDSVSAPMPTERKDEKDDQ